MAFQFMFKDSCTYIESKETVKEIGFDANRYIGIRYPDNYPEIIRLII
ncbi:11732_t:CDS:2 [Dentiscutata heterogama]|uniref:11732_t:CDS:1 n=1 Tax=Dentiscutata heterogama TaxID=1316150 RepID=A0ACA9K3J8_9GLOM|nr:11732_t:CDS:2 [Dentiscutata heterogama]